MFLCTVRECHAPLERQDRQYRCVRGHSFDIARSGYVNLLQPQDRKSRHPGDTPDAVAGRRRLHDRGVTLPLYEGLREMAGLQGADTVLDAGCGEGFYLGSLVNAANPRAACGIDISIPAIDAAARRYPKCQWAVVNADRFLPFADRAFTLVLSITARMNAAEFRRVLDPAQGRLVIALPAPDDLIELRGKGREDRVERTIAEFGGFRCVEQRRVTTTADLDAESVADVLHSIYRPLRNEPVRPMAVTFSLDLLLFRLS
jgi:23S rRNA (guanine745-N1)-methyltransferase